MTCLCIHHIRLQVGPSSKFHSMFNRAGSTAPHGLSGENGLAIPSPMGPGNHLSGKHFFGLNLVDNSILVDLFAVQTSSRKTTVETAT